MGVDEAGEDNFPGHIHLCLPAVGAHADNQPLRHGDVPLAELVGKHVDIGGVLQNQVGLLPAGGHLHNPQLFVQLAVDPAGIALSSHGVPSFLGGAGGPVIG